MQHDCISNCCEEVTCARPGQPTDPDNVMLHPTRSNKGGRVRNSRAVVSLGTGGCHSLPKCWFTLIWMNWFLAGLDADNGGRGQRRVLTRNRLRRRYPKHCQVKSTEYNYNRLGLLLQKIDSFSRCCISFQIPPSTVHNVPELFKGFWGDLESIIDHGNPSNHCSFHKYSREERKKEGEDWGGKSEGGSQADGPSDPLHNKLNRRIVYILTLRSTGTWSWSKDRVSFHSSKSTSSSKYSWSKKSSASSSQCSLSTLRWLSMSSSLIPPNPNSGCHSLSSAI